MPNSADPLFLLTAIKTIEGLSHSHLASADVPEPVGTYQLGLPLFKLDPTLLLSPAMRPIQIPEVVCLGSQRSTLQPPRSARPL